MNTVNQPHNLNSEWLHEQGYTIRQAAKRIKRSRTQVHYVLTGERKSQAVEQLLRALPKRTYRRGKEEVR